MIIHWKKLTFSKTRPHQEVIQAEGKINLTKFSLKFSFIFFLQKWRKRYFVLHAPPASDRLPGSSNCVLDYFKDHSKSKKKGSIDLDQCEEITASLDSAHYQVSDL